MKLGRLLSELEATDRSLTLYELAGRLDARPAEVLGMIDALRASGRLDASHRPVSCGGSAGCGGSCAGPDNCPLVIDLGTGAWVAPPTRA